jgi:hypothetical protein
MRRATILALLAACTLPLAAARAELPPQAYERMRQKATCVLLLAVQFVQRSAPRTDGPMRSETVTVEARVLSVIRGSGPKMGATVTIR